MKFPRQEKVVSHGKVVIYKVFFFDVAQSRMNGAPNETRTHSWRFASLVWYPLHPLRRLGSQSKVLFLSWFYFWRQEDIFGYAQIVLLVKCIMGDVIIYFYCLFYILLLLFFLFIRVCYSIPTWSGQEIRYINDSLPQRMRQKPLITTKFQSIRHPSLPVFFPLNVLEIICLNFTGRM